MDIKKHFEAAFSAEYYVGDGKEFVEVYQIKLDSIPLFIYPLCSLLNTLFKEPMFEPGRTQCLLLQTHLHANYPFWYTMQAPCGSYEDPNPVSFVFLTVPHFNPHRDTDNYSKKARVAVRKTDSSKVFWQTSNRIGKVRAFYDLSIAEDCSVFDLSHTDGILLRSDAMFSVFSSFPDVRVLILPLHRKHLYPSGPYGYRPFPLIHFEHPKAIQKTRSLSLRTRFLKDYNKSPPVDAIDLNYLNPTHKRYSPSTEPLSQQKWNDISSTAANVRLYPEATVIENKDYSAFSHEVPSLDASGHIMLNGNVISFDTNTVQLLDPSPIEQLELSQNPADIDEYVNSEY